jgi:hypothetical protein
VLGSILLAPFHGLAFVFREIAEAVDKDREAQREQIMALLRELHRSVETGAITEAEFERQEQALLDRLEGLQSNVLE